jgi:hypothetical protein
MISEQVHPYSDHAYNLYAYMRFGTKMEHGN